MKQNLEVQDTEILLSGANPRNTRISTGHSLLRCERRTVCPVCIKILRAGTDAIGYQLSRDDKEVDARGQNTAQSDRTDLGGIRRRSDGIEAEDQSSKELPNKEHTQRPGKELDEDAANGAKYAYTKRLLATIPFQGLPSAE
jgi:hypothetical protein